MFTILSSCPHHASGNVGDQLLTECKKEIIKRETGVNKFQEFFRSEDLTSRISQINDSKAVIMSFALREPNIYPSVYKLVENLEDLEVPIIPISGGWGVYPGDYKDAKTRKFPRAIRDFAEFLLKQDCVSSIPVRNELVKISLMEQGINDVTMVGDPGWYHFDSLGTPMKVPDKIEKVVFTTPHNSHYINQAKNVMAMLNSKFTDSKLICSLHSVVGDTEKELIKHGQKLGYEIRRCSHDTALIEYYKNCDLHVGYRLHGHIAFLRRRLPSVLINEDGRGTGFTYTLGGAGFNAYQRRLSPATANRIRQTQKTFPGKAVQYTLSNQLNLINNPIKRMVAPPDPAVHKKIEKYLNEQMNDNFSFYDRVPELIDTTYDEKMSQYVRRFSNKI